MKSLSHILSAAFFLATVVTNSSCDKLPMQGEETEESVDESDGGPGKLEVGGMPSEEEISDIQGMDLAEAEKNAEGIQTSTADMPLRLSIDDGESAGLVDGSEECDDQIFCMAQMFGGLQNLVTEPIACNMKLLMLNPDGSFKKDAIRKVKDRPIYYIDGWGTVGIGDDGPSCPDLATVKKFVDELMAGDHKDGDDEEFYLPTRYVMFKKSDGSVHWKIVFMPKDLLKGLSKKLRFLKDFLDEEVDFAGYHGVHKSGAAIGDGTGDATLDFTEFARMMEVFPDDDDDKDDGGMPAGKVKLTYKRSDKLVQYQTNFLDGFSFGDDEGEDNPLLSGKPITVMHSGSEHYFHLSANAEIAKSDDPDDDGGPLAGAQMCKNPDYDGTDDTDEIHTIKAADIAEADYLDTPVMSDIQLIWDDIPAGQKSPDTYVADWRQQGGPFIHGPAILQTAKKAGTATNGLRYKTPLCQELLDDSDLIERYNDHFTEKYGKASYFFDPNDHFQNVLYSGPLGPGIEETGRPSSAEMVSGFPKPKIFQFKDVDESVDKAIK